MLRVGMTACLQVALRWTDAAGITVIVDDLRIEIPEGVTPRRSLDSGIHVYFRMYSNEIDGSKTVTPICLFHPAQV